MSISITMINAGDLEKLKGNPRKQVVKKGTDKLRALISIHGFQNPLQVWRERDSDTYQIICGNHRFEAGKLEEMKEFPCIVYHGTKEEAHARAISDNKSNEWTDWDTEKLGEMLIEIDNAGIGADAIAFDENELKKMLENLDDGGDCSTERSMEDEDDIKNLGIEEIYGVEPGSVWQIGAHRIMCGDSTSEENVKLLMGTDKAKLVLTDPPYGMHLVEDFTSMQDSSKKGTAKVTGTRKKYKKVLNDNKDYDPAHIFRDFGYCKEMFLWGADYYAERLPDKNKGSLLIWDKRVGIEHVNFTLSEFETCWSRKRHARKILRHQWFGALGLSGEDTKKRVHPNKKPVAMLQGIVAEFSNEGDIIVDLFLGSGSTIIACENSNRKCYGMELDPEYCEVILNRWATKTGGLPKKVS